MRIKAALNVRVSRWALPKSRLKEEKDKAFKTIGDLELWLFMGASEGKAEWEKLIVQPGGHCMDTEHRSPYSLPAVLV